MGYYSTTKKKNDSMEFTGKESRKDHPEWGNSNLERQTYILYKT